MWVTNQESFPENADKFIARRIPFVIRIVLFREKVQHLVIDQLMEDIHLLIQLDQVFIEAGTLRRHFIVGLIQLLLQFIASVAIEYLLYRHTPYP